MKVLALNGSPRMKASATFHLLTHLTEGMRRAGAETELHHVRKLDLHNCIGCYSCWVRTPGTCIHRDQMDELLRGSHSQADLIVFGTPLYHFSMTATMKTFIDRTLPRHEPWLIEDPAYSHLTTHPERLPGPKRMFLVAAAGFPELEHFDSLVRTFKQLARSQHCEYVGELLRPAAEPLSQSALQPAFEEYYVVVSRAGEEIVRDGRVADQTQQELRKKATVPDKAQFYEIAGSYWNKKMDKYKVPEQKRHAAPLLAADLRDESAQSDPAEPAETGPEELAQAMADMYNAAAVPGLRATIQLHFVDSPQAPDWFVEINDDTSTARRGTTPIPTLRVYTPLKVWESISRGETDAVQAFTDGAFEVDGQLELLSLLPRVLTYPR